jgi:predicted membrane protein
MYKSVVRRILFGILFIILGVAVIGQVAGAWNLEQYSNGWWALFIIVPGLAGLLTTGFEFWNVGLIVIGLWLYCDANNFFGARDVSWLWLLGILLIILGVKVIFGSSHRVYKKIPVSIFGEKRFNESTEDLPDYNCVFSTLNIMNKSQNLKGGKATSVFGKMVLDLRDVNIESDIVFEVNSVFGSLDVIIPKNIPVRLDITPVFGNYHNFAVTNNADKSTHYIQIRGAAVFGQVNTY